jgi:hypothetical protein
MRGWYQDTSSGLGEQPAIVGPWRPNTLVVSASTGIAGLFAADPRMQGVAKLAFGAGDTRWDRTPVSPDPGARALVDELGRVEAEATHYVGLDGQPTSSPTPSIELVARISLRRTRILREFGVFIGEGSEQRGGGVMINNVTHERLVLTAGRELIRRVRFDFLPAVSHVLPADHWLKTLSLARLPGLDVRERELGENPPASLGELATSATLPRGGRALALQSIARHLLNDAAHVELVPELADVSLRELIRTDVATLARRHGSDPRQTEALRRRLDGLTLLSDELLAQMSLRRLVEG